MKDIEFISDAAYTKLQEQSEVNNQAPKYLQSIRYNEKRKILSLGLASGLEFALPISDIRELADVSPTKLKELRLSVSGDTIVLSSADVYISANGLLRDIVGMLPREVIAAQFAASGGARTSLAKKATSAENGRLGGRPKKREAAA